MPRQQPELSRYTLTRMHAEGGLGKVWLARDTDLHREVALKEIRPDRATQPDIWRRFLKEAQITGQLEHPNIVPVYELARRKEDDQPFYVMRFVRGQSLRDAIRDFHVAERASRLIGWRFRSCSTPSSRSARPLAMPTRAAWFTAT